MKTEQPLTFIKFMTIKSILSPDFLVTVPAYDLRLLAKVDLFGQPAEVNLVHYQLTALTEPKM